MLHAGSGANSAAGGVPITTDPAEISQAQSVAGTAGSDASRTLDSLGGTGAVSDPEAASALDLAQVNSVPYHHAPH